MADKDPSVPEASPAVMASRTGGWSGGRGTESDLIPAAWRLTTEPSRHPPVTLGVFRELEWPGSC